MTAPENPPEYNPQIPVRDTNIAEAQTLFQGNFKTLFDTFSINHIPLNDPTNPGNHNVIQLIELAKSETTQSQEIAIYSKKVVGQTDQLFMRYRGNGKEFQLTEYQIYEIPPITIGQAPNIVTLQTSYFTFLPGGIIVYFGRVNPTGEGFPINLQPAICSNITGVNLCPIGVTTAKNSLYQSNFVLVPNDKGTISQILLLSSFEIKTPPNQYYLVFGNI